LWRLTQYNNMKDFLTETQLFWATPAYNSNITIALLVMSVVFVIAGILVWMGLKNNAKNIPPFQELRNKMTSLFVSVGIIGLMLSFFGWQSIPFLSSRLLVIILAIIFIIWLISILIYISRNFSQELKKFKQDERYKKYLPRAK